MDSYSIWTKKGGTGAVWCIEMGGACATNHFNMAFQSWLTKSASVKISITHVLGKVELVAWDRYAHANEFTSIFWKPDERLIRMSPYHHDVCFGCMRFCSLSKSYECAASSFISYDQCYHPINQAHIRMICEQCMQWVFFIFAAWALLAVYCLCTCPCFGIYMQDLKNLYIVGIWTLSSRMRWLQLVP